MTGTAGLNEHDYRPHQRSPHHGPMATGRARWSFGRAGPHESPATR